MEIPEHYKRFYLLFIRFSVVMLVVGGLAGVLFQELTKSISFADAPPGRHIETNYHLALLHGHSFLIGSVIPICWIMTMHVALTLRKPPISPRAVRWITWTYLPGAVSVLALIGYKGLHYVAQTKAGETDFDVIHQGLFGGQKILRGVVYGVSHSVATIGLVIFAWVILRTLSRPATSDDPVDV